jgi:hypothetical protein
MGIYLPLGGLGTLRSPQGFRHHESLPCNVVLLDSCRNHSEQPYFATPLLRLALLDNGPPPDAEPLAPKYKPLLDYANLYLTIPQCGIRIGLIDLSSWAPLLADLELAG